MLYPLEGGEEPTLLDRIVPRTSRAQLEKARRWWLEWRARRPAVAAPVLPHAPTLAIEWNGREGIGLPP